MTNALNPGSGQSAAATVSRRQALVAGGTILAAALSPAARSLLAADAPATQPTTAPYVPKPASARFRVAVDDLFLLQRQNIKAFAIAQRCGLDGIGVDMGGMTEGKVLNNKLKDADVRKQFLDASEKTGVAICAMAFYGMYAHVFPTMPIAEQIMQEWIDTMVAMNVKIGHMPLMGIKEGTLKTHPEVWKGTVALYRKFAPQAEKAGVILGMESDLDGDGYKRFLDDVGSPAVKAVYNPGTSLEAKYDAYKDIRDLGTDRLAPLLHIEQGSVAPETWEHLLGDGLIDFPKLKAALMDINWRGWLCVARSRKQNRERKVEENYKYNAKFLHDLFTE